MTLGLVQAASSALALVKKKAGGLVKTGLRKLKGAFLDRRKPMRACLTSLFDSAQHSG